MYVCPTGIFFNTTRTITLNVKSDNQKLLNSTSNLSPVPIYKNLKKKALVHESEKHGHDWKDRFSIFRIKIRIRIVLVLNPTNRIVSK